MKLDKKMTVVILLPLVALVGIIGAFYFGSNYFKFREQKDVLGTELIGLTETENNLVVKSSKNSSNSSNYNIALSSIPADPSVPMFMTQLELAAKEAGLEVKRLSFIRDESSSNNSDKDKESEPQVVGKTMEIVVSGVFSGDTFSLAKYLTFLESARRITVVKNIRVNEERAASGERVGFEIGMSFSSYYMPKSTSLANGVKPKADIAEYKKVLDLISKYRYYDLVETPSAPTPISSEESL